MRGSDMVEMSVHSLLHLLGSNIAYLALGCSETWNSRCFVSRTPFQSMWGVLREIGLFVKWASDSVDVVRGRHGGVFAGAPGQLELDVPASESVWEAVRAQGAVVPVVSVGYGDENVEWVGEKR